MADPVKELAKALKELETKTAESIKYYGKILRISKTLGGKLKNAKVNDPKVKALVDKASSEMSADFPYFNSLKMSFDSHYRDWLYARAEFNKAAKIKP
jgi:hypothetical protein